MAAVTVGGVSSPLPKSQVLVTTLVNLQQIAGTIGSAAIYGINNDSTPGATTVIGGTPSTNIATTVTLASISPQLVGVVVENSRPTTIYNNGSLGNETIYAGIGGLTFFDYNTGDTIIAGGGTNTITFTSTSKSGLFAGDGFNTINVNSTVTGSATTIVGTLASSDTIIGSTLRGAGIVYESASLAAAFIDPGAHNATVIGSPGSTETVSVFGGGPAFTGSLTVMDGNGYFQGGSAGNNSLTSDSVGSTTLIGGGSGDVLLSKGPQDSVFGGLGNETLESAGSFGGVSFYASAPGANATTVINMHIDGGGGSNSIFGTAANEKVSVNDFVSGMDNLVLASSSYALTINGANSTVTSNGSTFTFNGVHISNGDIIK